MKKAVIRIVICIIMLIMLTSCIYMVNTKNAIIPDNSFEYDFKSKQTDSYVELDDYVITYNSDRKCYEITDKETQAKRRLFNEMTDGGHVMAGSMTSQGNTLYYGDVEKFCSYNIDTDTTTVIYQLATKPKEVKVFDVVVYYKAVSRQEIETNATNYIMYDGKLYIVTNRDVRVYDGKKTKIILKGEYVLDDYHNGRMELVKYNNVTGTADNLYELDLDKMELHSK